MSTRQKARAKGGARVGFLNCGDLDGACALVDQPSLGMETIPIHMESESDSDITFYHIFTRARIWI
jgi:hypothetical protein